MTPTLSGQWVGSSNNFFELFIENGPELCIINSDYHQMLPWSKEIEMRKVVKGLSLVLCSALLLVSGCAKDAQVKKDEPLATSPPPVTQPAPVPQAAKQDTVKAEVVQSQQIKGTPVTPQEQAQVQAQVARESVEAKAAERSLEKVFFDFDSFVLSQQSRDTLYGNAEYLLKRYNGAVKLEGHCDERGSDEYNLALGEKRAKSALTYLITLGVPAERLSVISYGKEKPADPGHNEEAWAKNRRVEFVITK